MNFKKITSFKENNKTVLLRADLNVPMKNGSILDTGRIQSLIPTIHYLKKLNSKIILISHFGRPQSSKKPHEWDQKFSLLPLKNTISEVLQKPVTFIKDCMGKNIQESIDTTEYQSIILLENLRFYPGEEENDFTFAKRLSQYADIYVNDAFSCCHRSHASVVAITNFLPSYAGKSLENELLYLHKSFTNPQKPLMAIVAGSKISTKLLILENLANKVDTLFVGGAMANTFLKAQGYHVENSLIEPEMISEAKSILLNFGCKIILPQDVITKNNHHSTNINNISNEDTIYDIGLKTCEMVCKKINSSKTLIWNGPLGVFEIPPFEHGTRHIAQFTAEQTTKKNLISIAGGGETASALKAIKAFDKFSFVSTAGGAFLEWLEGKPLPGLKVLEI